MVSNLLLLLFIFPSSSGVALTVYCMRELAKRAVARRLTKQDVDTMVYSWLGFWSIPPLGLAYAHLKQRSTARVRVAALIGTAANAFALCLLVIFFAPYPTVVLSMVLGLVFAVMLVIVYFHRLASVPVLDRVTVGFASQLRLFAARGLTQLRVDWRSIAFDIAICASSGLLLGTIFYQQAYVGPVAASPDAPPVLAALCAPQSSPPPANLAGLLVFVCTVPQSDPIFPEATLSGLAVALAAVASSLRIFGAEKANFARESSVGSSTEAYYLGKSLAHMPIVLLAPLAFTVPFYTLARLHAPFIEIYLIFALIYATASGLAYFISILLKESISQLVGVLSVLVMMFFSGGQPRLPELDGTPLIYPTYVSFVRWSQELFYTTEIGAVANMAAMDVESGLSLYGYTLREHWNWHLWFYLASCAVFYRLCAYVALVKREQ